MTTSFCGQAKGQDEEQHDRAKIMNYYTPATTPEAPRRAAE
jgi:hypothetical protein